MCRYIALADSGPTGPSERSALVVCPFMALIPSIGTLLDDAAISMPLRLLVIDDPSIPIQ
ncbi:MAG: hypothetical protein ACKVW3_15460 [Phycisphaerales bacterium]